jgi:SsrA-binding protein
MSHPESQRRALASNRRARREYEILETFEAGLALTGTEVKSARLGRVQLKDSHVEIRDGEAWLIGAHFSPYSHGNRENHEPERSRKLLLHRRELDKLFGRSLLKGQAIVPLSLYLKGNRIKLEIALARGRKHYDKRALERQRILDREAADEMHGRGG